MDMNTYTTLLQLLNGNGSDNDSQAAFLEQLVSQQGVDNPKMQLLMQYLANQHQAASETESDEEGMDEEAEVRALLNGGGDGEEPLATDDIDEERWQETPPYQESDRASNRKLRQRLNALYHTVQEQQHILATFALAIGSCQRCLFGTPTCPTCQGTGTPGAYAIDQQLFRVLIAPALPQYQQLESEGTVEGKSKLPSTSEDPSH